VAFTIAYYINNWEDVELGRYTTTDCGNQRRRIDSPGLRAAVDAVVDLGDVVIAAPLKQQSGNGRSFARVSDGRVETREIVTRRGPLPGYAIDANPRPSRAGE